MHRLAAFIFRPLNEPERFQHSESLPGHRHVYRFPWEDIRLLKQLVCGSSLLMLIFLRAFRSSLKQIRHYVFMMTFLRRLNALTASMNHTL